MVTVHLLVQLARPVLSNLPYSFAATYSIQFHSTLALFVFENVDFLSALSLSLSAYMVEVDAIPMTFERRPEKATEIPNM